MTPVQEPTLGVTDIGATTSGLANRFLVPLLRTRAWRRLGRRLAVIEYSGRRTGQRHQLVTMYTADGRTVRIDVGRAASKTWWRNFQTPHPIRLRLAGADFDGVAHLERAGTMVTIVAAEIRPAAAAPQEVAAAPPGRSVGADRALDRPADAGPRAASGHPPAAAIRLSLVTAAAAAVAAVWTFTDPGLLHGPAAMQGSARGTALVLGAVAVPVLLRSLWKASRGLGPAWLMCAGSLAYVVYNAVLFLFLTPFNAAFLVYVTLLGLALWSLGYVLATGEVWRIGRLVADRAPVRGIAAYVWVVAGLNAAAWLASVIPSLGSYPTPLLEGTGVQTNAIYVQDLAIWLPLAAVGALWLRRRQARGAVVVAAVLGLWVIEAVSIAVDQWFGVRADPNSTVVSTTLVGPFLALAAVGLVPLWLMLRTPTDAGRRPADALAAHGGSDGDLTPPEAPSGAQRPWNESPAPAGR